MNVPVAIGVGCRGACPAQAIEAIIRDACAGIDLDGASLFTHTRKEHEAGLHQAAATLGLPLVFLSADRLAAEADRVSHRSSLVESLVGTPSVAEAAALAGAGPGARLIVTRIARAGATCAVAVPPGVPA